ncbi:antibiotic biosynthesis monooxygenase [Rhodocytophaga aerolata]|uniref:Antibiotic biosynthesis monooxygenase n=1 Tax=Rhodocytophaga aerolata TaxID=455078 RepID=A0ABT8RIF5_9BACT|nr:antibiotic biosynthesis monooxygenase [Rhodocytophaga aerolata]MDO1451892.1 antibiotic biosynthesis monooxygenase [Rhodocytophaga aerolata]
MKGLQLTSRFQIHKGKLEAFKTLANECISLVQENEPNALQYDWFFNSDQTECVIRETFTDSNALLAHIANLGEVLGKIQALGDFSSEIYGNPSEELMQAVAGMDVKVYSFYRGLERAVAGKSR